MKKFYIPSILILLVLSMGCDLYPHQAKTIYFYALAGEDEEDTTATLAYRKDGYTIIMSRGSGGNGGFSKKDDAEALKAKTEFMISLDGENLSHLEDKGVDRLGKTGFHVVQAFFLPSLTRGIYVLEGKTLFHTDGSRVNKVFITIY